MKAKLLAIFPIILLLISFALILYGTKQHAQSWYFQDETEHLTIGWSTWRQGKSLYVDTAMNHQPIPYLIGAVITKVTPFNTLFQLVKRVRVMMWLFVLALSFILTIRFKWVGLLTSLALGFTSFWYFGFYVLAESLAAPVIALHLGLLLLKLLPIKTKQLQPSSKKQEMCDATIFGLASVWLSFTLSPLWVYILISGITYYVLSSKTAKTFVAGSALIGLGIIFAIVSPVGWYEQTIYNVTHYVIADYAADQFIHFLMMFFYPFRSFFYLGSSVGQFLFAQLLVVVIGLLVLIKNKKLELVTMGKWLLVLVTVLLINNRVYQLPAQFYQGFHLYPFIAGWSMLVMYFAIWTVAKVNQLWLKLTFGFIILVSLVIATPWIFEKQDKLNEHFINYGGFQSQASLIQALKSPGETLLTGPNGDGYINLVADIPFAGNELFHLAWAWRSPKIRQDYLTMLEQNPPTYVIFPEDGENGFEQSLRPKLEAEYTRLLRLDGNRTDFMILTSKLDSLTAEQKEKMELLYYKPLSE